MSLTESKEVAAPAWFSAAIAQAPERRRLDFEGAHLDVLAWGSSGAPGVLLMHGYAGHADWWSFIAPSLAEGRRVIAFSWSGMGESQWRERYSVDQFAREAEAVAEAEGLFDGGKPTFIAHSMGGVPLLRLVDRIGERLNRAVLIDPLLRPSRGPKRGKGLAREHSLRRNREELIARFRFKPPSACPNDFILEWLAHRGIADVPQADGSIGYRWSFDPNLWDRLDVVDVAEVLQRARCPLALVAGADSPVVPSSALQWVRETAPPSTPIVTIPNCGHHVLADQPLALIAVLQALVAPTGTWNS